MLKEKETELRAICPFCDSITLSGRQDAKFYINLTTGLYYCFHCQEKGKDLPEDIIEGLQVIDTIEKKNLDPTALAKLSDQSKELNNFLSERFGDLKIQDKTLLFSHEHKAIAIAIHSFNGELVGIKYRKLDPDAKPRYLSETGSVNDGYWIKGLDDSKVLILEGELDAITAQLVGFNGHILACQTNRLPESSIKHIKASRNVFILPDNDLGGTELVNSCNGLLGSLNPIVVSLPNDIKDLNELLQRRGYEECSEFIRIQTKTQLERDTRNLKESIPELISFLSDKRNTIGDSTGWNSIDLLLGGGLRSGEMSVINAFAKTGKTSFLNNLVHNLAKSGKKVALASFEMDPSRSIYPTLISIASGINIRNLSDDDRVDLVTQACNDFKYLENIITLKRFGYTPWEEIEEWAILMKRLHNIEYLVLDHAGFMVEKMTDAEENQVLAKNIKKLTNTLGIHIPIVVQAPKTKDGLSIQTSYGGLAWGMNADNFIILERSKDNETELKVKLEAARYPGANPSTTPALLFYDKDSCTLSE